MGGFWAGKRVCITGGTGFLGWQIARQLLDLHAEVRVLALPPDAGHPIHREARFGTYFGDVRDPVIVQRALQGCPVVFHTAGVVGAWRKLLEVMWSVHREGTANVLKFADADARIVHTSSLTTIGGTRGGEILTEESPFNREGTKIAYVQAKRAAENAALQAATEGRDVVVTNPGYLVGPEDYERSIMGRFCVRFWKGRIPLAPPGGFNLVDVRDVATGHLLAAERGQRGRRYLLGGENHRFPSFEKLLAQVAHYRPRGLPRVPWILLAAMAGFAELRSRLNGKEPYPSMGHVRLNRYCWFGSSQRASDELGYTARPLLDSLRDSFAWHNGHDPIRPRGLNRWWIRPS